MKTLKLLVISFTMTFLALLTISPAIAKPSLTVHHVEVNSDINIKRSSYNIISIARKAQTNLVQNTLSTDLIFNSPSVLSEEHLSNSIDILNTSTTFFTSIMLINDKLHQLISYFSTSNDASSHNREISKQDSKLMKKKCKNDLDFS